MMSDLVQRRQRTFEPNGPIPNAVVFSLVRSSYKKGLPAKATPREAYRDHGWSVLKFFPIVDRFEATGKTAVPSGNLQKPRSVAVLRVVLLRESSR
jgi:hypothetical protein